MSNGAVALLSSLLSACGTNSNLRRGSALHSATIKRAPLLRPNALAAWNALLSMYSKCGDLHSARKVFDRMPLRDTVTWNSIISGFICNRELVFGFRTFSEMRRAGSCPLDHATLTTVLSACVEQELLYLVRTMHGLVISNGFGSETPVANSVITAYFKCGSSGDACASFVDMPERNVISWTAMVSGLAQSQLWRESLSMFCAMRRSVLANSLTYSSAMTACSGGRALLEGRQIHALLVKSGIEQDQCAGSAIMDMYSKCGLVMDAHRIFQSAQDRDSVSYTVILTGFAQNGLEDKAFELFLTMVRSGMEIDEDMVSAVLGAFEASAPCTLGRQIHAMVVKNCLSANVFVDNGLINMYSKCGNLEDSFAVFNRMNWRNSISWNSAIAAFARHGYALKALEIYEDMKQEGFGPTDVTFLSLLHACSHVGAVEKGVEFLRSMVHDYGIAPRSEHYASVVDMLGRAARLSEAKAFVDGLPVEPDALIWQSFLGVCLINGDLEMGRYATKQLLDAAPGGMGAYVSLANICSLNGAWKERARVIKKMKEMKVRKEIGMSWIEDCGNTHTFVVGSRECHRADDVYSILDGLTALIGCEIHDLEEHEWRLAEL